MLQGAISPTTNLVHPNAASTPRLDQFLAEKNPPTPFLVLDLDVVRARYQALREALPGAEIYYAIKANPDPKVIATLADLGARFDVASPGEIEHCRVAKIAADRLSFGNTIKRESAIRVAAHYGIDLFAFDSEAELEKLARSIPGSRVFCRLLVENKGAEWPLTRKFGCDAHMAADLLMATK